MRARFPVLLAFGLSLVAAPALAQSVFVPLTPCRVVDTRVAANSPALAHASTRSFTVQGTCGVPSGARAVSVNVTAVGPSGQGHLRLFPALIATPNISTINFPNGLGSAAIANGAIVPLSASTPDLSVFTILLAATGSVHFVLDVTGYFSEIIP